MEKRYVAFCGVLALLCVERGVPQTKSMALSGDFSAAALQLVRAVDSYEGVTEVGVPEITDALSVASARAHTQGDAKTLKVLRTFLEDKLDNNALRDQTVTKAVAAWRAKHTGAEDDAALETVKQNARTQPGVVEITRREDDCTTEVSRMLRSGLFHDPLRCQGVRLSHDEHAMQQFFPPAPGS